jgi:hypothetical protein
MSKEAVLLNPDLDIDAFEKELEVMIEAGRKEIESTLVSIDWGIVY